MNNVSITYPVLGFNRRLEFKVPTSWGELTSGQFVAIVGTVNGAVPDIRFLSAITGIGRRLLRKIHPYNILKLSESISFVGNSGTLHPEFIVKTLPGTGLVCPRPKLSNMQFGQFIFADAYYMQWIKSKNETALDNFVATIFLNKGEKFDSEKVADRSILVSKTEMGIRQAIAFNWGLIVMWLQKAYPLIFVATSADEEKNTKIDLNAQSSWLKLFDSLVGDDLINRDRYAELPVHSVFRFLTEKFKENSRMKSV